MRPIVRLRSVALLLAGAYALHSLRYLVAFGEGAGHALRGQGHAYLDVAPAALTLLLAAALGELLARIARGGGTTSEPETSLRRLWAVSVAALMGIFVAQELAEGWLSAGRPDGLAAVAANGGWIAGPLSVGVGLLVALLHRGATAALAAKPARLELPRPHPLAELRRWWRTGVVVSRVPGPWLGGRGPPAFAG
jgi:hypothetical protein